MRNILTICSKEIKSYFVSPIAYLLLALFGLISGYFFYSATAFFVMTGLRQQMQGSQQPMSVNDYIIAPLLGNSSVVGLFLIPLISMRLFAEEMKQGTLELLLTSPVRDWEIVIGKWAGAMLMYLCVLGISVINIGMLFIWSTPDWRPLLTGLLGIALQGGCLLAIGTFISTTTKNQIIAGGATFAVSLLLWVLSWVTSYNEAPWAQVIAYLAIPTHYEPFAKGVLDTKDLIYYLSVIFFGLFMTKRSLESLRWRA